jgi:hypothetical protein
MIVIDTTRQHSLSQGHPRFWRGGGWQGTGRIERWNQRHCVWHNVALAESVLIGSIVRAKMCGGLGCGVEGTGTSVSCNGVPYRAVNGVKRHTGVTRRSVLWPLGMSHGCDAQGEWLCTCCDAQGEWE